MKKVEEVEIRSLYNVKELEDVRLLESKIWGKQDSIPTHQTLTAVKNGGIVLGAYFQGQLIAFQYSFPGFNGTSPYLCSHVLGTDPAFRNRGIGEKLKWAQRKEALKLGYSLITWTYDPLESINGYLNIGKLGGVCSTYIPNCYGDMVDLLNEGIPTDRFLVEWHLKQDLTKDSSKLNVKTEEIIDRSIIRWEVNQEGFPIIADVRPCQNHDYASVYVAIPKNFREIKKANLNVAIEWREKTREVFTNLFEHGWQVNGFNKNVNSECPVYFYVLTKQA